MSTKILKAQNGAKLIEAVLMAGTPAMVLERQFTVMSRRSPMPVYQGPNLQAAEAAFEKAAN